MKDLKLSKAMGNAVDIALKMAADAGISIKMSDLYKNNDSAKALAYASRFIIEAIEKVSEEKINIVKD